MLTRVSVTTVLCAFLTDCHDSTCTFPIVMLKLMYAFIVLVLISVCEML